MRNKNFLGSTQNFGLLSLGSKASWSFPDCTKTFFLNKFKVWNKSSVYFKRSFRWTKFNGKIDNLSQNIGISSSFVSIEPPATFVTENTAKTGRIYSSTFDKFVAKILRALFISQIFRKYLRLLFSLKVYLQLRFLKNLEVIQTNNFASPPSDKLTRESTPKIRFFEFKFST